jgi:hypothetical protein
MFCKHSYNDGAKVQIIKKKKKKKKKTMLCFEGYFVNFIIVRIYTKINKLSLGLL